MALRGQVPQAKIAEIAGCSAGSISNWENGTFAPPSDVVAKLARHWRVSADYLVGLSDFPSGLAPDSWIVDLDAYENLPPGAPWSRKAPRRNRVVDYEELKAMEADVAKRSETKRKGKRNA